MEKPGVHHIGEKEFEVLFREHFDNLMGFVCSYVHDSEVARDLVHDAYMAIWSNRMRLDASRPLTSYLFVLARNYALDWIRHRKVELGNEEAIARMMEEGTGEVEDYEASIAKLREKLGELPDKQREVVVKCFMEGKMYKEVAGELGISLNTVKTHLQRALKFLRDELQDDFILLFMAFPCY